MTAISLGWRITCDHPLCDMTANGPFWLSRAQLRKDLRKAGWTCRKNDDRCPEHAPPPEQEDTYHGREVAAGATAGGARDAAGGDVVPVVRGESGLPVHGGVGREAGEADPRQEVQHAGVRGAGQGGAGAVLPVRAVDSPAPARVPRPRQVNGLSLFAAHPGSHVRCKDVPRPVSQAGRRCEPSARPGCPDAQQEIAEREGRVLHGLNHAQPAGPAMVPGEMPADEGAGRFVHPAVGGSAMSGEWPADPGLATRETAGPAGIMMCQAHPDDCPLGPEPHEYVGPEGDGPCCCVQPQDDVEARAEHFGSDPARWSVADPERLLLLAWRWLGQRATRLAVWVMGLPGRLLRDRDDDSWPDSQVENGDERDGLAGRDLASSSPSPGDVSRPEPATEGFRAGPGHGYLPDTLDRLSAEFVVPEWEPRICARRAVSAGFWGAPGIH